MHRNPSGRANSADSASANAPSASPPSANSTSALPRRPSRKKSVSLLPPRVSSWNPEAHEKILARKPTPFNSDLAEQIRNSGIFSAIDGGDIELSEEDDQPHNNSQSPQTHSPQPQSPSTANDPNDPNHNQQSHMPNLNLHPAEPNGVHINHIPHTPSSQSNTSSLQHERDSQLSHTELPAETPAQQNGHATDG